MIDFALNLARKLADTCIGLQSFFGVHRVWLHLNFETYARAGHSSLTASLSFDGALDVDVPEFLTYLVLFSRIHLMPMVETLTVSGHPGWERPTQIMLETFNVPTRHVAIQAECAMPHITFGTCPPCMWCSKLRAHAEDNGQDAQLAFQARGDPCQRRRTQITLEAFNVLAMKVSILSRILMCPPGTKCFLSAERLLLERRCFFFWAGQCLGIELEAFMRH